MLSSIGRAAVRRVVAPGPQSTNRAFRSVWHLQHVGSFHHPKGSSALAKSCFSIGRAYATATEAALKSKTTTTKSAKSKKPVAKKAAKKPVKKVAAKKKKAVKKLKPKPVGRPRTKKQKEPQTEEERKKVALKALKAQALAVPKKLPQTAWIVFHTEIARANRVPIGDAQMIDAGNRFKSMSPAELEHYNHIANQNKAANAVALKQWIESHTPDQIRTANNARALLRKKDPLHTWRRIHDDRIPKQPTSPSSFFMKEKYASGDLKGIKIGEAARLVAKEWAALPLSDRKTYEDQAAADKQRYIQEFKTVFHRDPKFVTTANAKAK